MKIRYLLITLLLLIVVASVSADWLTGWNYRKELHINGSVSGDVTDYQVMISVYNTTGSDDNASVYIGDKANDDTYLSDIRFTTDDGTTLCDTWNETVYADHSDIWVEVPSIDDAAGADVYLYYGSTAGEVWDGDATFIFFDDFDGSSLDTEKWCIIGTPSIVISDSYLEISGDGGAYDHIIRSQFDFSLGEAYRSKSRYYSRSQYAYFGLRDVGGSVGTPQNGQLFWDTEGVRSYSRKDGVSYYDGETTATGDTFFIYDILRISTTTSLLKINGTTTLDPPEENIPIVDLYLWYRASQIGSIQTHDWVLIRKIVDSEPAAASWSAEETAPCIAAFSGTPLTGSTPLTVQFTDTSTTASGAIDTWLWDFGDGSPGSSDEDPAHTYTTSGCYDVKLKITNTLGMYDWENKTAYVCAGNVTPTPTTVAPTPTGTPPTQPEIPEGHVTPLAFVVLAFINCGLVVYTFADNENRNYLYIPTAASSMVLSFLLGLFLIAGTITEDFVVTLQAVSVNASVLSTHEVERVAIADPGFGYFFVFWGVVMMIITILAVIEVLREPHRRYEE